VCSRTVLTLVGDGVRKEQPVFVACVFHNERVSGCFVVGTHGLEHTRDAQEVDA